MFTNLSIRSLVIALAGSALTITVAGFLWLYTATQGMPAQQTVLIAGAVTIGLFVLCILPLSLVVAAKVIKPVNEIKHGVERILDGDYTVCFSCDSKDELGEMRLALDTLLGRLKHNLGFAQGVLKGIDTPFVVVDTDEVLTYTNPSLIEILEHDGKPEDYYGQNVAYFFYGDSSRRTVLADSLEKHIVTKREVELTGRQGGKRKIYIHASPLFDLNGELMGALCIYQDLTELRARETEIISKNEAIEQAVDESEGVSMDVARTAEEIARQVDEAVVVAQQQTERAIDTATAMEQMNAAVYEVARNASSAAQQANEAREKAREGASVVDEAMKAIADVTRLSEQLKQNMAELGQQADGIGEVMNVINDIADQTNLLALNAAIEAARAGEAGRGFAVVADEVRKLAEKTMQATKEVGGAISAIQDGARRNAESVDQAVTAVERSRDLSSASGDALNIIVRLVSDSSDQVQAIATAAEEQSSTSEHINQSVEEVKDSSQRSAAELERAASGIRELTEMAEQLRTIIHSVKA